MTAVAELAGADLDYWVARAEGFTAEIRSYEMADGTRRYCNVIEPLRNMVFIPTTSGDQGIALIFKHNIAIAKGLNQITFPGWHAKVGLVAAYDTIIGRQFGLTPLVAAMRALVWSVYGDNVPDEVNP